MPEFEKEGGFEIQYFGGRKYWRCNREACGYWTCDYGMLLDHVRHFDHGESAVRPGKPVPTRFSPIVGPRGERIERATDEAAIQRAIDDYENGEDAPEASDRPPRTPRLPGARFHEEK
jgi:hypothetical protein